MKVKLRLWLLRLNKVRLHRPLLFPCRPVGLPWLSPLSPLSPPPPRLTPLSLSSASAPAPPGFPSRLRPPNPPTSIPVDCGCEPLSCYGKKKQKKKNKNNKKKKKEMNRVSLLSVEEKAFVATGKREEEEEEEEELQLRMSTNPAVCEANIADFYRRRETLLSLSSSSSSSSSSSFSRVTRNNIVSSKNSGRGKNSGSHHQRVASDQDSFFASLEKGRTSHSSNSSADVLHCCAAGLNSITAAPSASLLLLKQAIGTMEEKKKKQYCDRLPYYIPPSLCSFNGTHPESAVDLEAIAKPWIEPRTSKRRRRRRRRRRASMMLDFSSTGYSQLPPLSLPVLNPQSTDCSQLHPLFTTSASYVSGNSRPLDFHVGDGSVSPSTSSSCIAIAQRRMLRTPPPSTMSACYSKSRLLDVHVTDSSAMSSSPPTPPARSACYAIRKPPAPPDFHVTGCGNASPCTRSSSSTITVEGTSFRCDTSTSHVVENLPVLDGNVTDVSASCPSVSSRSTSFYTTSGFKQGHCAVRRVPSCHVGSDVGMSPSTSASSMSAGHMKEHHHRHRGPRGRPSAHAASEESTSSLASSCAGGAGGGVIMTFQRGTEPTYRINGRSSNSEFYGSRGGSRSTSRRRGGGSILHVADSVAIVKRSQEPYADFMESMVDMIVENGIGQYHDLKELLGCFLSLNSPQHHPTILKAFAQVSSKLFPEFEPR